MGWGFLDLALELGFGRWGFQLMRFRTCFVGSSGFIDVGELYRNIQNNPGKK